MQHTKVFVCHYHSVMKLLIQKVVLHTTLAVILSSPCAKGTSHHLLGSPLPVAYHECI